MPMKSPQGGYEDNSPLSQLLLGSHEKDGQPVNRLSPPGRTRLTGRAREEKRREEGGHTPSPRGALQLPRKPALPLEIAGRRDLERALRAILSPSNPPRSRRAVLRHVTTCARGSIYARIYTPTPPSRRVPPRDSPPLCLHPFAYFRFTFRFPLPQLPAPFLPSLRNPFPGSLAARGIRIPERYSESRRVSSPALAVRGERKETKSLLATQPRLLLHYYCCCCCFLALAGDTSPHTQKEQPPVHQLPPIPLLSPPPPLLPFVCVSLSTAPGKEIKVGCSQGVHTEAVSS
ncbi:hypothetical protein EYD10_11843 [Varanus komodoensis]|nr:hypothetical protein EYD10_11843 [Varanus komodoensis]